MDTNPKTLVRIQPKPPREPRASEVERRLYTRVLREVFLEHVDTHVPRSAGAIFEAVRNDFGPAETRRLWRVLARALAAGTICRVGQIRHSLYVRPRDLPR